MTRAVTRPLFTLTEAEAVTGASRSTLRRRLREGAFPSAAQGPDGTWRVPVEDLLAAGLRVNAPDQGQDQGQTPVSDQPRDRVAELEQELALERSQRQAAEQLAAERAERIVDLRNALRMLDAGPVGRAEQAEQQPQPPAPAVVPAPLPDAGPDRRRHWWGGLRRDR
jgi:hypothetical protein